MSGAESDADSDVAELENDIEKFNRSVTAFISSHQADSARLTNLPRRRGVPRGPRKAAEPKGEVKARLTMAIHAFINDDYSLAKTLVFEVIRINAETYQAWVTLASIFEEEGDPDRALMSTVYAAHLRPNDIAGWLKCADIALKRAGSDSEGDLRTARLCYSAALRADPRNTVARLGRAGVCRRQGHTHMALADYKAALGQDPLNIEIIRKLAETCMESGTVEPAAIRSYEDFLTRFKLGDNLARSRATWDDARMYAQLYAGMGQHRRAVEALRSFSRWLLGRAAETYWDEWTADDREWDSDDVRRSKVSGFACHPDNRDAYGLGLPLDVRALLALYRLVLGDVDEAMMHLAWLDPTESETAAVATEVPSLVADLASQLLDSGLPAHAVPYFELLRSLPGQPDSCILLNLGLSHLSQGDRVAAEECFLAAIEADGVSVEARIELARIYEAAGEYEEALILVNEALALQDFADRRYAPATGDGTSSRSTRYIPTELHLITPASTQSHPPRHPIQRQLQRSRGLFTARYRPKRLVDAERRRRDEEERAQRLSKRYQDFRSLKQQIRSGQSDLAAAFMQTSGELVDEFRSSKQFYSWDKYLKFLGRAGNSATQGQAAPQSQLDEMAARLTKSVGAQPNPHGPPHQATSKRGSYRGIAFDDWLNVFLDYALCLALSGRYDDAAQVCEAAKDSTVFVVSADSMFLICVTWGVCAMYAGDDEACVSMAKQIIRDDPVSSDAYRMFALLCRLCQSPVSWYTSGPAQKFIMRQVKAMDAKLLKSVTSADGQSEPRLAIDAILLMLYGHVLFASASYSYSLHYFLRARSLQPSNPVVNLSIGLAFIHYGLRRQSVNRQYLLMQGLGFVYSSLTSAKDGSVQQPPETRYNVARTFQLLGLQHLATSYYELGEDAAQDEGLPIMGKNTQLMLSYNEFLTHLQDNDVDLAMSTLVNKLIL